jgi:hypothetical protein
MKRIAGNGKRCLKLNLGYVLTLTGFCCGERHWLFGLRMLLLVGIAPSENLSFIKRILFGWLFWELNPVLLGSLWLKAFAIWGVESLQLKASVVGEAGRAPFESYPGIWLTTAQKHGKPQSGQPISHRTTRCADLAVFWGTASAGLLHVSSPRLCEGLQSVLGRHRCLPSCRSKGLSRSAFFESKLSISALMWLAKNGIPKSSWICLLPTYQGALVALWRHLDCKTSSFWTWLWAADLQIGHAWSIIGRMSCL